MTNYSMAPGFIGPQPPPTSFMRFMHEFIRAVEIEIQSILDRESKPIPEPENLVNKVNKVAKIACAA